LRFYGLGTRMLVSPYRRSIRKRLSIVFDLF
jgi:hypothetical protein